MPLTFPSNPTNGQTASYLFTDTNGVEIKRLWTFDSGASSWVATPSNLAVGGNGAPGADGATGIVGEITAGGVGMFNAQRLSFFSSDSSVDVLGITSDSGITIDISGGGANPQGPDTSIQFKDSTSLSGISEATIVSDPSVLNPRGFSGNFVYYTESPSGDSATYSTDTIFNIPFGTRNIITLDNIALGEGQTLTFSGLDSSKTGASLTLIIGHTGTSGSTIVFPSDMGIYWSDGGPFGVTTGGDAKIYPTSNKKIDVLYFFSDGNYLFGNLMNSFKQSR